MAPRPAAHDAAGADNAGGAMNADELACHFARQLDRFPPARATPERATFEEVDGIHLDIRRSAPQRG